VKAKIIKTDLGFLRFRVLVSSVVVCSTFRALEFFFEFSQKKSVTNEINGVSFLTVLLWNHHNFFPFCGCMFKP